MAYGTNGPFGLQARQFISGDAWDGQTNEYPIASGYNTNIFNGDPVYYANNGTIVRATAGAGNPIAGVFSGAKYIDTSGNQVYAPFWPANTVTFQGANATAFIIDDPNVLFDVQAATTIAGGITAANLYENANIDFTTAGSTISGQSGATISGLGNGATLQVKIMRFTPNPKNAPGIQNNNVLVLINNSPLKGGTGTVGV